MGVTLKMSEAELQSAVVDLAALLGWRVAHFRPAMTAAGRWVTPVAADGKGFVDLVMAKDRVLFVELKSDKGVLSAAQGEWAVRLRLAGAEYHVWRPGDWTSGEVERVLRGSRKGD